MRVGETLYFDYQASTPLDPRVSEVMRAAELDLFANPHASDHVLGWRASAAINEAARQVAGLIGMDGEDLTFTSGASEANAMVFRAASQFAAETGRTHIIIGEGDHSSILNEARNSPLQIQTIPLTSGGSPDLDALRKMISKQTALVSLIGVSNETGAITDIPRTAFLCENSGALFHADLSQAPLVVPIDMFELGISFATLSSHKLYGPKGIGALVSAPPTTRHVAPLIFGGGQQNGRRGGTLPTELCVGFGKACAIIQAEGEGERRRVADLRDAFVHGLESKGLAKLVGDRQKRHPGNALMHFPGLEAGDLLSRLQPHLAASSQSACSSGTVEPSRVIQAMGFSRQEAAECIRFSLGRFSDETQIQDAIRHIVLAAVEARTNA
jgi:cysteine desulfurase